MDAGTIAVIVLRLVVPFSILRYPLGGFVAAFLLDVFDAPIASIISPQGIAFGGDAITYNLLDKPLDLYFLFFAFLVSLRWQNVLAKRTAIALFLLRALGVTLFSLTDSRYILFFFPNLIEFFYLYYLISQRWFPRFSPDSPKKLLIILIVLLIPKLINEYFVHVLKYTLVDIINLTTPLEIQAETLLDWLKDFFR